MSRRLSFTENRRRRLAKQPDQFRLEPRTTITEPISLTGLAIAWMRGGVQLGLISPFMGSNAPSAISAAEFRRRTKPKPWRNRL